MTDWQSENEFRWVLFCDQETDIDLEFGDSLAGIVFGDEANPENVEAVIDLTEAFQIEYMGLKWKNDSPWYDYGNLQYSPEFRKIQRAVK